MIYQLIIGNILNILGTLVYFILNKLSLTTQKILFEFRFIYIKNLENIIS